MGERAVLHWRKILQSFQSSELCLPQHKCGQRTVRANHPNRQSAHDHLWLRSRCGRVTTGNRIASEVYLLNQHAMGGGGLTGRLISHPLCHALARTRKAVSSRKSNSTPDGMAYSLTRFMTHIARQTSSATLFVHRRSRRSILASSDSEMPAAFANSACDNRSSQCFLVITEGSC